MPLADTHKKLQQGQGFADLSLVDAYIADNKLPKIHEAMGKMMDAVPHEARRGALDLGACHGLLSVRARRMGWHPIIGVETDPPTVEVFDQYVRPRVTGVTMEARRLDVRSDDFMPWLTSRCRGVVNTVLARRAFPELFSDTYGAAGLDINIANAAGHLFTEAALHAGIEFIVIEGRQHAGRKGLTNPLYRVDLEVQALGPKWSVRARHKECVLLERAR